MKRAYVDLAEGQMHYRYAGGKEPLIMLHMSGSSSDEFEKCGDLLAKKYAVYAPDFLAFGYSDRPPRLYTLAEHAGTVLRFMDALGITSACLIGNLVGANIAVHAAMQKPEKVNELILFSFCYSTDYEEFRAYGTLPEYQPIPAADDGSHLVELWKRTQRYQETKAVIAARTLCMHLAGEWSESLHAALFSDMDLTESLGKITVPAKLVGAPAEEEKLRLLAALMPNARYEIEDELNPFFNRKYPDQFIKVIEK